MELTTGAADNEGASLPKREPIQASSEELDGDNTEQEQAKELIRNELAAEEGEAAEAGKTEDKASSASEDDDPSSSKK